MYEIRLFSQIPHQEIEELVKLFLPRETFTVTSDEALDETQSFSVLFEDRVISRSPREFFYRENVPEGWKDRKNAIKRGIYQTLAQQTGYRPPWGILTGVKPVKIVRELFEQDHLQPDAISRFMEEYYYLQHDKNQLLMETMAEQRPLACPGDPNTVGLYIGIPFCPTRCVYCSFPSNTAGQKEIERYLNALKDEIRYTARRMKECRMRADTVYIGGGTPTSLSAAQMEKLLAFVFSQFDLSLCREFTVEAGRPDTIDREKLRVLRRFGIRRISINPQSMNPQTLTAIGRNHTPEQILQAHQMAREEGFERINMDLIAGLPGEGPEDFLRTVEEIIGLEPENITIHTLALKRASRLKEQDDHFNYKQQDRLERMVGDSRERMRQAGYRPYYLYRQKYMVGNFENVGYAKPGTQCIYNIRTMDERQTMIALGAGGISKICFPEENRIERTANVSNYEIYIERIEEMKQRKEKAIFSVWDG